MGLWELLLLYALLLALFEVSSIGDEGERHARDRDSPDRSDWELRVRAIVLQTRGYPGSALELKSPIRGEIAANRGSNCQNSQVK